MSFDARRDGFSGALKPRNRRALLDFDVDHAGELALDLRHVSPSRGEDGPPRNSSNSFLPARPLKLGVVLPVASPAGSYELGVFNEAHTLLKSAQGTTTLEQGVTRLSVSIDLSSLKSGAHLVGVRTSLSDWMFAPVTIR